MSCVAEKVTALIVRETPEGRQLLLFRHSTAGIQIPAGTIEEGEEPEAAALREGQEESGLTALAIVRRHFYLLTPTAPTPEESWAVDIDNHIFRPFWAPLSEVPATGGNVIEPQRHWLEYLREPLDGVARVDAR